MEIYLKEVGEPMKVLLAIEGGFSKTLFEGDTKAHSRELPNGVPIRSQQEPSIARGHRRSQSGSCSRANDAT